jgi:AcrR family transcriptional regulator
LTVKPLAARSNRRVHSKSIERRQRILDAAARALAEDGYAEAKLSDIAQEAGTHAGGLYYYFQSREDLVMEVLLTSLGRMSEFFDSLEDGNVQLSPLDRILAFVRLVIEQTLAPDDYYFRAYMRNGNQVPDNMREVLKTRRQRMRRTLAKLLREAQAAGQIPAGINTSVAAQFIIGATNWVGMWYEPTGPYSVDKITETFVDLILHGLLGKRGLEVPAASPR